jgi:AcrR family transcriptional regulator
MTDDVRTRLLLAAESLIAERGLEGVSLREITAAAAAGNASAVQYHFGGRAGLIEAVVERHHPSVEARRHALLDQYDADGSSQLRTLAGALVRPLAAELAEDGGPGYLQLMADLATRPRPAIAAASVEDPADSTFRWRAAVEPLLDPRAVRMHRRFTAIQFTLTELARRGRDGRTTDNQLYVSHLVDLVTAVLGAPVSSETDRLLLDRTAPAP